MRTRTSNAIGSRAASGDAGRKPDHPEPLIFGGTRPGGRLILYDGNHRLALARERGDTSIEALIRTRRHCRE